MALHVESCNDQGTSDKTKHGVHPDPQGARRHYLKRVAQCVSLEFSKNF